MQTCQSRVLERDEQQRYIVMGLPRTLKLALASIVLSALSAHGASPPVTVSLQSSFPASDPLLEAFESVAAEDPSVLFPLLSVFSLTERPPTPQLAHNAVFTIAADHMDWAALNSARVRLALHALTARLAASADYYDRHIANLADSDKLHSPECSSWVDWYGQIVCDAELLLQLANSKDDGFVTTGPKRLPFDHVHRISPSLEEPRYIAIHFADPTAPSFHSIHEALLSLEPKVEYILRWAQGTTEHGKGELSSHLSGYGVSLDLKKMDYLVLDDRNQHQAHWSASDPNGSIENGNQNSNEELLGCIFDSLPYIDQEAETRAMKGEPLTSEEIDGLFYPSTWLAGKLHASLTDLEPQHAHQCWNNHHTLPLSDVELFQTLTNSFPLYATSLARKIKVSEEVKDEVYDNSARAAPGMNIAWVNGRVLNENEGSMAGIFGLLRTLKRERTLVKTLVDLGLTTEQAIELLMHPAHSSTQRSGFSASKTASTRGSAKVFAAQARTGENDVEERKVFPLAPKFADYLEGLLQTLAMPIFDPSLQAVRMISSQSTCISDLEYDNPQLLRVRTMSLFSPMCRIRQNLVNVIYVLDLSNMRSLSLLSSLSENFVDRGFPVRWGFVPIGEGDSLKMTRLVYYVNQKHGRDQMITFIRGISRTHAERRLSSLSWQIVEETFRLLGAEDDFIEVARGNVPLVDEATGEDIIPRSQKYSQRLGVGVQATTGRGHVFVNGRYFTVSDNILQQMVGEISTQLQILQEMAYSDTPLMPTFFYDLPSTLRRRNPYILVDGPSGRGRGLEKSSLQMFNLPEVFSKAGFRTTDGSFVVPSQSDGLAVTVYVIADFDSHDGLELAKESLKFMTHSVSARVTFIHNSDEKATGAASTLLSTLFDAGTLRDIPPSRILEALANGSDGHNAPETQQPLAREDAAPPDITRLLQANRLVARQLGLRPGQRAVLVNGRLVGPLDARFEFDAEDFEMLESFEMKQRVSRVADAIDEVLAGDGAFDAIKRADLISMASSIIYADQQPDPSEAGLFDSAPKPRSSIYRLLSSNYTKLAVGEPSSAQSHIAVLVDPLSETAQRWSTILARSSELFPDIYIEVYFHPAELTEIPLKRFYRYNLVPHLNYDANGQEIPAQVTFSGLPMEPIYTMSMDVPPSWLVRPREALYDLDNIQLGNLPPEDQSQGIQALFALDYLVVEGHARELNTVNPPRGVQLQLIDVKDGSAVDDTQVVANLGYLQFKARPGMFRLEIREGRGRDIYELESVGTEGWNSPSVAEIGDGLVVMNFDGLTLYPRLARKPGKEMLDVLDEMEAAPGEGVTLFFTPKDEKTQAVQKQGDGQANINIFTVASGLLYERFASIMILSVLRNTNSSVKFWFIENFLSPSFLSTAFQYELVTYKWPSWLRLQKEKQRIIWAYKILFLDVLFPMDLKKVIFVDADQIVRADLQELVDLDLHGAPYGYTPMGDDNYGMEGFRFWKTGYWRDFLDGRSYHISALYVVDLVRFRQMAAGDLLRGSYQMLSQDPNSLANLDQDLPNNLQAQVPIYSLHEDWLWCETWCSKDRLHRAKTIDLCQNPLTKEPKLSRARQIPEWEEYDNEIARFARRLAADGKIHASVATADSNVLAGSSGQPPSQTNSGDSLADEPSPPHDEL
ncbi:UDP-glucose:Glycoprotein glucosyltransferase-domain-containing protein [Boletus edulis BED1]|uniref:UDP-glucose:Glycoprotein glucosyltransferase-domain-containing protein n=1 Tax=Boletus edulis BED1 TaxID=1328754 RepID=A0AAD4GD07_BOLED|nr:UDP-glucose:Glycoprotein glucosyltransferase-domain-containing protein [Boletus edulis BED1]